MNKMAGQKSYRQKVRDIRPFSRQNPDGTPETVLLEQADNYAYPTIFPVDPNDPESGWLELHGEEAFNEARNRGELFPFDSEKEAKLFAEGNWKHLEEKPTSKSIDDIMQQSNIAEFLSESMSDRTNVETTNKEIKQLLPGRRDIDMFMQTMFPDVYEQHQRSMLEKKLIDLAKEKPIKG
jgi:hypothetical protein